jgi:hypothetical protein
MQWMGKVAQQMVSAAGAAQFSSSIDHSKLRVHVGSQLEQTHQISIYAQINE